MPHGDKSAYTEKQKRQARHIEESYEERGVDPDKAAEIAWATVNKESGGVSYPAQEGGALWIVFLLVKEGAPAVLHRLRAHRRSDLPLSRKPRRHAKGMLQRNRKSAGIYKVQ